MANKWYNTKSTVILLCIFFFPIGLYGLWKSEVITKTWKIVGSIFTIAFIIVGISQYFEKPENNLPANKNQKINTEDTIDVKTVENGPIKYTPKYTIIMPIVKIGDYDDYLVLITPVNFNSTSFEDSVKLVTNDIVSKYGEKIMIDFADEQNEIDFIRKYHSPIDRPHRKITHHWIANFIGQVGSINNKSFLDFFPDNRIGGDPIVVKYFDSFGKATHNNADEINKATEYRPAITKNIN